MIILSANQEYTTPVEELVNGFDGVLKPNQALVCSINNERSGGRGYIVGVATQNERGYIPTHYVCKERNMKIAQQWVDEANAQIFKDRTPKDTYLIVLSTMR